MGRVSDDHLARVKAATDPVALAESLGLECVKATEGAKAVCPFHGDGDPSLSIYIEQAEAQPYHCHGCGWHGDQIDLVQRVRGCEWREAFDELAKGAGIDTQEPPTERERKPRPKGRESHWSPIVPVPDHAPRVMEGERTCAIVRPARRRDAKDQIRRYTPSLVTAYCRGDGALVGYIVRIDCDGGDKIVMPVTWCRHRDAGDGGPPDSWATVAMPTPRPLANADRMVDDHDRLVVFVEGEKKMAAAAAIFPQAIITTSQNGAGKAQYTDWQPLSGHPLVVWPDNDPQGAKHAEDVCRLAGDAGARVVGIISMERLTEAIANTGTVLEVKGALGAWPPKADADDLPIELAQRIGLSDPCEWATPVALPEGEPDQADCVPVPVNTEGRESPQDAIARLEAELAEQKRKSQHHKRVMKDLQKHLAMQDLVPDAISGWRNRVTWSRAPIDHTQMILQFLLYVRERYWVSKDHASDTLQALVYQDRRERRQQLIGKLCSDTANDASEDLRARGLDQLRAWVDAVVRDDDISKDGEATGLTMTELAELAMLHWIRNVKRLALGWRTEHDLMPVVYGVTQGSGKTTAVERLTDPWAELAIEVDASYLTDERRVPVLGQAVIGRWEEMQGAQRSDIESLKNTISSPVIDYRPMRTNETVIIPRSMTFVGTSNLSVDIMVQDTTGARRFIQLNARDKIDWESINAIDYQLLWQCIGPADPSPLVVHLHELRLHQSDLVHRDPVSMWLQAEDWRQLVIHRADHPGDPDAWPAYSATHGATFEEVCARFNHWCRTCGQSPIGAKTIAQRLKQEGFVRDTHLQDRQGRRKPAYLIPQRLLPGVIDSDAEAGDSDQGDAPW